MKKYNGFTLIELLAIIVILAIIAVITVPVILNVIDNAKKGAAKSSAYGYKDSVNKYYYTNLMGENGNFEFDGRYTVNDDGFLSGINPLGNDVVYTIGFNGKKPDGGFVNIVESEISNGCLQFDEYAVPIKNNEVLEPVKTKCDELNPAIAIIDGEKGNLQPGDMVIIGDTEKFYVVSSDNSENGKTVLLAKYHLNISFSNYVFERDGSDIQRDMDYDPNIPLGIQANGYIGFVACGYDDCGYRYGSFPRFSWWDEENDYAYWRNKVGLDGTYKYYGKSITETVTYPSGKTYEETHYENPFPYVYDENSEIYPFIQTYRKKLIGMGAPSTIKARLLSLEEAVDLGCSYTEGWPGPDNTCSGFVAKGNTWLGTAYDNTFVFYIHSGLIDAVYGVSYEVSDIGIRPVIEVPTSSIQEASGLDLDYPKPCGDNCLYAYYTDSKYLKDNLGDFPEEYAELTSDIHKYKIYDEVGKNIFLGHLLDNNGKIDRAFVCGIKDGTPFCLEGTTDGSSYESNLSVLDTIFGEVDEGEEYSQTGDDKFFITVRPTGEVEILYEEDNSTTSCVVSSSGEISCSG